jgi:hypothetical protein
MLPNAVAVCVTSPNLICPANSRGAWISHGGRMMIWLI